jgi:L-alanine-DL-glutamate epimerase-like enolase superfamily enzyme
VSWSRLASLPLTVEGYELSRLAADPIGDFERKTTIVRLVGGGTDGLGEDITLGMPGTGEVSAALPLAGEWTLERFCDHLQTVAQWATEPEWAVAKLWRNWAFESAALDLALRQAGLPLHAALGREPRPLRFVNSLGLGEQPDTGTIHRRLAHYPDLRFKIDAHPAWTDELVADLAATGAVDTIDFKGMYGLEVPERGALLRMYDRVLAAFDDTNLEDAHDDPDIAARLRPHAARLSYDAPIHAAADLEATPLPARTFNIKPSRIGGLRPLFAIYEHCEAHGYRMYGGGMGELGVGRHQIQLLASLFHPDGPNDVAPSAYNEPEPAPGLPTSPLPAAPAPTGFRREH